jgi:hypothetical protein
VFISMIFLAIPSMRNGTSSWASLELPGMVAALHARSVKNRKHPAMSWVMEPFDGQTYRNAAR